MRYEGLVYRPPSEANSVLIQATIGCPHNKCTFCNMYKAKKFRIRPVAEIKEDILLAADYYGKGVETMFFPDGNTIFMRTQDLVEIFTFARQVFPKLQRITLYGSAKFLNLKTAEELCLLHQAGLTRIHCGMETGDDVILEKIQKGSTSEQIIEAGKRVKAAGIELSEYIIVGIGGQERWREHALNSARVLNAINPDYIRLRTLLPLPGTQIRQAYLEGKFDLLSPHQALKETRLLLENLNVTSWFLSDHISNYWSLNGKLPADKLKLLTEIDYALTVDEACFRPKDQGTL